MKNYITILSVLTVLILVSYWPSKHNVTEIKHLPVSIDIASVSVGQTLTNTNVTSVTLGWNASFQGPAIIYSNVVRNGITTNVPVETNYYPIITGYLVCYSTTLTNFPFTNTIFVDTNTSATMSQVPIGIVYYWYVVAERVTIDTNGNLGVELSTPTRIIQTPLENQVVYIVNYNNTNYVEFQASTGHTYTIQRSTSIHPTSWANTVSFTNTTNAVLGMVATNNAPMAYYRLHQLN